MNRLAPLMLYSNQLTPGLAEVRSTLRSWPHVLGAGFRVRRFRGIPPLKTS